MATSLAFNEQFYLSQNLDVVSAIARGQFANAQQHFNLFGADELRDPNQFFDTSFYLAQYPDVLNAGVNPLDHFLQFGAAEGRFANATFAAALDSDGNGLVGEAEFDADAYLELNPDLAAAVGPGKAFESAFEHFVLFGQFESRPGTPAGGPFTNTGTVPGAGDTITLTTGVDALNGTNANDTFLGTIAGDNTTFNTGDVLNGGSGQDRLNLTISDATDADDQFVEINSIEAISLRNVSGSGVVLDGSGITGAEVIENFRSTSNVGFEGLQNNVDLSIVSSASGLGVDFDADVLGADATVNLSATGALSGSGFFIEVNGNDSIKVVNLDVVTDSAVGVNLSDEAEVFNISGAGSVEIENFDVDTLETLDASKNTGGVEIDLSGATELETVTGGSGDDRFVFATVSKDVAIDGGAGNDIVAVDGGDLSAANSVAGLNALTSIETIEFVDTAGTTTISGATFKNATVTELLFNTAGADVVNQAGARLYSFGSDNGGSATFNSALGQTTLNLALKGDTTVGGDEASVGNIVANGATTINIASSGTSADANTISLLTVGTNSQINITGSQDLELNGVSNASRIDGSAATGDLKIVGSAAGDIIIGGAGDDIIDGGAVITTPARAQVTPITVGGTIEQGDVFTITINGVDYSVTAPATPTAQGVAQLLVTEINNANLPVTATTAASGAFTLVGNSNGTAFTSAAATTDAAGAAADGQTITQGAVQPGVTAVTENLADTLTGGAGADTFVIHASEITVAAADTITDFVTKIDSIDFSGLAAATADNYNEASSSVATFAAAQTAANAAFAGNTDILYSAQQVGSDTYVFAAPGASDTAQQVVKLSGVSLTGIEFGDIV